MEDGIFDKIEKKAGGTKEGVANAPRRPRFIGRTDEFERLNREMSRVADGAGRIFAVVGEAGVGKTRLVEEYLAQKDGFHSVTGSAEKGGQPYAPFIEAIKALVAGSELKGGDEKKKVMELATELEDMLGINVLPDGWERPKTVSATYAISARRGRSELLDIVTNLFVEASQGRPLAIFIDNFHWADISSIKLLRHMAERIEKQKIAIFLAYRPTDMEESDQEVSIALDSIRCTSTPYIQVQVQNLDPLETLEMVESILEVEDMPTMFIKKLYKETGGNPLFVEGIINTILEEKRIDFSDKHWYVKIDLSSMQLPKTIFHIMEGKIEKMDERTRNIVDLCAVAGQSFNLELLKCAAGLGDKELGESMARLQRDRFVKPGADEGEYKFTHTNVMNMVYSNLEDRGAGLHDRVGSCMETIAGDDIDEYVYEIAKHFNLANNKEKALKYNELAGDKAMESYAPEEAVRYYKAVTSSYEGREPDAPMARAWLKLGRVFENAGIFDEGVQAFKTALDVSQKAGEKVLSAESLRKLGDISRWQSDWDAATKSYQEALGILEEEEEHHSIAGALRGMGYVMWRKGDHQKAVELYDAAIRHAEKVKDVALMGAILIEFGNVYSEKGELEKALRYYKKSLEILPKVKNYSDLARAYNNIGDIYLQIGQWKKAVEFFNKCGQVSGRIGNRNMMGWALFNAGEALAKDGELDKALNYCDGALRILEELGDKIGISAVYKDYGIIYGLKKDWGQAIDNFEKSLALIKEISSPYSTAETLYEYGIMYKSKGDSEKAGEAFANALKIVEEIGAKGLEKKLKEASG